MQKKITTFTLIYSTYFSNFISTFDSLKETFFYIYFFKFTFCTVTNYNMQKKYLF